MDFFLLGIDKINPKSDFKSRMGKMNSRAVLTKAVRIQEPAAVAAVFINRKLLPIE